MVSIRLEGSKYLAFGTIWRQTTFCPEMVINKQDFPSKADIH